MRTASGAVLPCGRPLREAAEPEPRSSREAQGAQGSEDERVRRLIARLEASVEARGLNRSGARAKILETIAREARHFRPQDLLVRLQKRHPEVGRATLYRNLPILVELGLLQEGPTDSSGQAFYELADDEHHDHIICVDCGKIFEFHDQLIEKRQTSCLKTLKFTTRNHRHVIYAKCDYLGKDAS